MMSPYSITNAGFGTTGVIVVLAGLAVITGVILTYSGSSEAELAANTAPGALQQAANDRAETETAVVTDAAAERAAMMDNQSDTDLRAAPADDTTPAVLEAEAEAGIDTIVTGTFTDYSPEKLDANATNVLFFHADWCPSCRGLEDNITTNMGQIPANVNILKLDYDSETELKQRYGVIRQHTLVVVDGNGNEIKKLTGLTNTLEQVVTQL